MRLFISFLLSVYLYAKPVSAETGEDKNSSNMSTLSENSPDFFQEQLSQTYNSHCSIDGGRI